MLHNGWRIIKLKFWECKFFMTQLALNRFCERFLTGDLTVTWDLYFGGNFTLFTSIGFFLNNLEPVTTKEKKNVNPYVAASLLQILSTHITEIPKFLFFDIFSVPTFLFVWSLLVDLFIWLLVHLVGWLQTKSSVKISYAAVLTASLNRPTLFLNP